MTELIPPPGSTEDEFGIPVPGVVLPQEQWARTALKKLPDGILDWDVLFGRTAERVIDIGCGNGRSTLVGALSRPECDFLGVDILPVVIRYATRRANHRGLHNTRWAVIGGRELLLKHIAAGSISEVHCYHPQPWYRRDQVSRRLITPEFLSLVHRSLQPGGRFVLQTDHPLYWSYMLKIVPHFFEWRELSGPWPEAPAGMTRRELIAMQRGLPIFRGEGRARSGVDAERAMSLAESLPLPIFNADRRLLELDRLEQGGGAAAGRSSGRDRGFGRRRRR
ncbi:MAG: tRNA (guanine(46)-N(7))-methyltransferase TrmB [Planctomycetaceae bacterium]|jgi:tRNA (guanine-N7-)-methyltransferase